MVSEPEVQVVTEIVYHNPHLKITFQQRVFFVYSRGQFLVFFDREAAGLDLKSMMQSWTRKTGFPVVTIEEMVQLSPAKRQFKLTQKRHLDAGNEDDLKTLWNIPISVITKSSPDKKVATFVMKEKMEIVEVEGVG